jgi:hypothetical protein
MFSSTNDLSTHLLGSRQHEEDDARDAVYDEEESGIPCSLKIVYDEELEDSQSSSDNKQSYFLSFRPSHSFSLGLMAWRFTLILLRA